MTDRLKLHLLLISLVSIFPLALLKDSLPNDDHNLPSDFQEPINSVRSPTDEYIRLRRLYRQAKEEQESVGTTVESEELEFEMVT